MQLLGPNGQPISSYKKERPLATGPSFGKWGGDQDIQYMNLPGGGILQFDLSALTIADYRSMRYNPQINASLSVLTFMLHQVDWHIESKDKKLASEIEDILRPMWTRLVRALSQAFWAGYSPIAIEYENNVKDRRVEIGKFKDLVPEDCSVNWKEVTSTRRTATGQEKKFKIYDGIKQWGEAEPIPAENTVWYPLLMENGDYRGRKLLKAAFMPWYFSTLIHLFSNRYYERFGEPLPIGRAPFEDSVPIDSEGTMMPAKQAMEMILTQLRNRSVVTLPSERQPVGNGGASEYTWDIEYLESQMRGADFERYMTRLDEEMSIALFTPLLLLRNADVGSHNLGVQHTQTWLWMLNALTGDMKEYIDRYVVRRLADYNSAAGLNHERVEWVPRQMGKESAETLRAIISGLISGDKVKVDVDELGVALGMKLTEVKEVTRDNPDPNAPDPNDPNADPNDPNAQDPRDTRDRSNRTDRKTDKPRGVGEPRATGREISARIRGQVEKAWREDRFGTDFVVSLGYHRRFIQSLEAEGFAYPEQAADDFYHNIESTLPHIFSLGKSEFSGPSDVMALVDRLIDSEVDRLLDAN